EIEDLEKILAVDLLPDEVDEDIETLGGLVFAILGRVPQIGELISHPSGVEFEVVDADLRRVKRLMIRHGTAANADDDEGEPGDEPDSESDG
ncbi:MAG: transporter associated domain-containing protein, partial [Alphaproteobacteria bacterium]|nr:transporter associated domain-containing protein [Alphaproteobacteria bacterium]